MKQKITTLEFIRIYSISYFNYIKHQDISRLSEKEESELYWILKSLCDQYSMKYFSMKKEFNYIQYTFFNELSSNTIKIFQFPENIWKEKFIMETESYREIIEREYF